jgi:hypothetical protein
MNTPFLKYSDRLREVLKWVTIFNI